MGGKPLARDAAGNVAGRPSAAGFDRAVIRVEVSNAGTNVYRIKACNASTTATWVDRARWGRCSAVRSRGKPTTCRSQRWRRRSRGAVKPQGKLPFALANNLQAVIDNQPDAPGYPANDTLYPFGFGLSD